MQSPRIVVLISGNGSNLQVLIDATISGVLEAEIVAVISNRSSAYGLVRAELAQIESVKFPLKPYKDRRLTRQEYDRDLAEMIETKYKPDLIVLAGWMHILSPAFLDMFPRRVINLHPALPGTFDGIHAIERAYDAFKSGRISHTGVMVHYVIRDVDRGDTILARAVEIKETDTLQDLEDRMHATEHQILLEAVIKLFENK